MKLFTSTWLLLGCFAVISTASEWMQHQVPLAAYDSAFDDDNSSVLNNNSSLPAINTEVYSTTYRVVVNVSDLHDCTDTPTVHLSGFPWKVRVCKRVDPGKTDNLNVFLVADIRDPKWSIEAKGNLYIRQNGNDPENYFQNSLQWKEFTAAAPIHGVEKFLMTTPLTHYETNGKLRFKFQIETKPARLIEVEEFMQVNDAKLRLLVKRVSSLNETTASVSSVVKLRDIRWTVSVTKLDNHLAVAINANPDDLSTEWFIKVSVHITAHPCAHFVDKVNKVTREIAPVFDKETPSHVVGLLPWHYIQTDSHFVINDTAALTVSISTSKKQQVELFRF